MKIEDIKVYEILDSRGDWTIEVEMLADGIKEKTSLPSGKSKGSYEAINLSYQKIKENLGDFLKEIQILDFKTSKDFDNFLIEKGGKDKEKLGANFTLGASIVFARILAKNEGLELYQYLKKEYQKQEFNLPGLVINLIGGGVHSFNNLDFQEYWLVLNGFDQINGHLIKEKSINFRELLIKILEIIDKLENRLPKPLGRNDEGAFCTNFSDNYEPFLYLKEVKNNFELGADIASNQITKLVDWERIYDKLKKLNVRYLEDPFKENEFEKFAKLKEEGFKVIGDDLTVTNVERLKIALDKNSIDGVIVKPNQVGTILETFKFIELAKENNLFTIFSHRSGETNDDWIIDLGISFEVDFFKIGPPVQGERIVKYNRLLEILDDLNYKNF